MTNPISWNTKVLLAKPESSYGTDAMPASATDAILFMASNVSLAPMEGDDVERDIERPYFGAQESFPVNTRATLSFDTELAGSGAAGTAPPWGVLMRGCGMSETISAGVSVTYAPVSASQESLSVYFFIGNTRYVLLGARGDCTPALDAQGIPKLSWKLTGLFSVPTESAPTAPTLTAWKKPLVGNSVNTPTFTVNAVSLVLRSWKLAFGNEVQPRMLIRRDEIRIADRKSSLDIVVEAVPLTTLDPYTLANARTTMAVNLTHGVGAGNIFTINAPKAQLNRPAGINNQNNVAEWPLSLRLRPNAGNDEFSIVCT